MSEMPRPWPSEPLGGPFVLTSSNAGLAPTRTLTTSYAKPNRVKYSDAGIRATIAATGSMTLEARAMIDRDGVTLLEVTTGSFETRTGLDLIEKIQVKVANSSLSPVNDWPDAAYWSIEISGLVQGAQLQIQANVKGFNSPRTEIVNLTLLVVRRPDIAVSAVDGAASAYRNAPVTFFATVRELNGSVGARANCVLTVDGVAVDQATGIWVDANDVVNCQFTRAFQDTGTYTVGVIATEVNPNDWDLSNNAASRSISVVDPGTPIAFGSVTVKDEAYTYSYVAQRGGSYPIESSSGGTQMLSTVNFFGTSLSAPGPIQRAEARVSTGETTIYASAMTQITSWRYDDGVATVDCGEFSLNGERAQSCASLYRDGTTSAWFFYAHSSGTVTYYGRTLYCNTFGCNTYTSNTETVTGWGDRYGLALGSTVRVEIAFVDAAGVRHLTDRTVTLEDFSGPVNYQRNGCYAYWDGLGDLCYTETSAGSVWKGTTIW